MTKRKVEDSLYLEFQKKICIRDIPGREVYREERVDSVDRKERDERMPNIKCLSLIDSDVVMSDPNENCKNYKNYKCSLHDNDISICSIYGCSGGDCVKLKTYNYIS